ncbi:GW dipeptide domain-containing protein [Enterococcus sp. BWR-S5]|uniref:GW dipeptide domain-containing protein n=1 Tax=Enterococcus sp. BWR-S5 TaxID=2787714 RepID=UPI001923D49E|nr:GW dipeptide domain-containing protein [Enterococcus sp. BWR-S5]MBL1226412.1 SH3-like domain-containing protein [Enterococcus sp. BWR-S5]
MANEGAVLIAGNQWLGGQGVPVYANGGNYNTRYQCVELPQGRLYPKFGWPRVYAAGNGGATYIPEGSPGLTRYNPGSKYIPVPGDLVIENTTSTNAYGHVSVVDYTDVSKGIIYAVEQNASANGRVTYSYNGSNYAGLSSSRSVRCILHAPSNTFKNPATYDTIKTQYGITRSAKIISSIYNEYGNAPYKTQGYKVLGSLSSMVNKAVTITQVAVTSANNKLYQFKIDGNSYWADYRNFSAVDNTISNTAMNRAAKVTPSQYDEYGSNSYNELDYRTLGSTKSFSGREVTVLNLVKAKNGGTYYKFRIDGKDYWTDCRNLSLRDTISSETTTSRTWRIISSPYNEYGNVPYNTAGYTLLGSLSGFVGRNVPIHKVAKTSGNNTLYQFTLNGKQYWADHRNFENLDKTVEDVVYNVKLVVTPSQYDEYGNNPYNALTYKTLGSTKEFAGRTVQISRRVKTQSNNTYYQFTVDNKMYWSDYRNFK